MTKVTQPVFNLDLPEYQRFKAESAEILLSNVSFPHVYYPTLGNPPEIGLSEPTDRQANPHDAASKMLDELAEYELQKERESHFGKARIIKYPPVSDERINQPFEHEPDEPPAKKHDGKPPPLPPVVGVRLKKTTAEVIRVGGEYCGGGSKGEITEISQSSIKNAVEILTNSEPELNSMIVCTYPETFPMDGRIVKAHFKALKQAIKRRFGEFEYFLAVEYQKRSAPHFHLATSIDLAELGEVVTLKRKKKDRRSPTFQTVKEHQDWLFSTWKRIISKPNPAYDGIKLAWDGISPDDSKNMDAAYFEHHSAVAWECMRSLDGAKRYFVKELSGLKSYQKSIPLFFEHPGRHFLYSPGMKFNDDNALTFAVSEAELRQLLIESGWEFMPADDKPLFKRCWNAAVQLAIVCVKRGFEPIEGSLEALRKYAELRLQTWTNKDWLGGIWGSYEAAAAFARAKEIQASVLAWEKEKSRMVKDNHWTFTFSQEPMGP